MKIVIMNAHDFTASQKERLSNFGDTTFYDKLPNGPEEYLERVKDVNIICSGKAGLKTAYPKLKNVFISVPFVSVAFTDPKVLKSNNVTISNAPGVNRYAVSEWIITMMILLTRDFKRFLNTDEDFRKDGGLPTTVEGTAGKKLTILGHGNVGTLVGDVAKSLGMKVKYFERSDNLHESVKDADFVVDTLSSNPTTFGLINKGFFDSMKKGSYFVTVTGSKIVDMDALLSAINEGKISGAASDCGGMDTGDTKDPLYLKLKDNPRVLVSPHISYNTKLSIQTGIDVMIDNVEAWINGKPQNVVEE